MIATGLGGVGSVLYLIGEVCALMAYPTMYDSYSLDPDVGAGSVLLILGLIFIVAAVPLGFVGIDDDDKAPADSAGMEAQAANQVPPATQPDEAAAEKSDANQAQDATDQPAADDLPIVTTGDPGRACC